MDEPLQVNSERLKADFDALSEIGSTGDGGVNRPTFSEAHLEARAWFRELASMEGFEVRVDGAGNVSAVLSVEGAGKTLLIGSHLDSVYSGGRFDGALGLLAAFESIRVLRESGQPLAYHIEAIDFTDEEGTLVGLLGSIALIGLLKSEALKSPRGGRQALEEGLTRSGLTEAGLFEAQRDPKSLAGFLELHIEQGPRLAKIGTDIGVVTSIVGARSFQLVFKGHSNHAGTTPMPGRNDAGLGAAAFVLAAREVVLADYPDCVCNVGQMNFDPGGFNIIPGRATLSLEFRAPDKKQLKELRNVLLARAEAEAERFGLTLEVKAAGAWNPIGLDEEIQAAFEKSANNLGLSHKRLHSGAGHDTESLARITRSGMIFIPSPNGISHDPREFSEWSDCLNGANVLLNTAYHLARKAPQV